MANGRSQMADGGRRTADGRRLPGLYSPLLPLFTRHSPLFRATTSSRQLGDQGDQRHEEGDDDEADDAAEDDDHDRLEEADQRFHGHFHLFVVVVGDLVEHGVELAGLLAHVDHVDHDVVDDAGLAQGLGDRLTLADALVNSAERPLEDRVARRLLDDVQRFENRHARLHQGAQRAHGPRHRRFLGDGAHDRNHQQDPVANIRTRLVPIQQLDEDPDQKRRQEDDVEVLDQEVAGLDQHDRHARQGDAEVFEDRLELGDDVVEDEAHDDARNQDDHDRVDHGSLDLPLERLGLFLEVGQALEDRFESTAGLARLDHVAVEPVERLGMLGERLGERLAALEIG